eukprot:scaffold133023_cov32-Tisochrysis_lutea.AAC.3
MGGPARLLSDHRPQLHTLRRPSRQRRPRFRARRPAVPRDAHTALLCDLDRATRARLLACTWLKKGAHFYPDGAVLNAGAIPPAGCPRPIVQTTTPLASYRKCTCGLLGHHWGICRSPFERPRWLPAHREVPIDDRSTASAFPKRSSNGIVQEKRAPTWSFSKFLAAATDVVRQTAAGSTRIAHNVALIVSGPCASAGDAHDPSAARESTDTFGAEKCRSAILQAMMRRSSNVPVRLGAKAISNCPPSTSTCCVGIMVVFNPPSSAAATACGASSERRVLTIVVDSVTKPPNSLVSPGVSGGNDSSRVASMWL